MKIYNRLYAIMDGLILYGRQVCACESVTKSEKILFFFCFVIAAVVGYYVPYLLRFHYEFPSSSA